MSQKKQEESRKRVLGGDRARLSNWHFGALHTGTKQLNSLQTVNGIGARYAQTKQPEDIEYLIAAFNNYIMKYVSLLTTGHILSDNGNKFRIPRDTKMFLALFLPNGIRSSAEDFSKAAARLPNAFITMDANDIYNELAAIFLDLANKFDGRGGFTGYIYHRFGWAVKARMFQVQKDPINYQPLYYDPPDDSDRSYDSCTAHLEENDNSLIARAWVKVDNSYKLKDMDFPKLNHAFITCPTSPFDKIWTKQQRSIIVMMFCEELSDSAISERLGLGGAANVRKIFNEAITSYRSLSNMAQEADK